MTEEEEIKWFSKANLSKYNAIVDNEVVVYGDNAKDVWVDAKRECPEKTPSLAKVPKEELLILQHQIVYIPAGVKRKERARTVRGEVS
jgi:hypothetical protein